MKSNMTKPVILTGLRANNNLTIGNYFGAMQPIIETSELQAGEYQINMFIPDLHSFTTPIDHSQLQEQIIQTARLFVAAGLQIDNEDILLYRQSYVPAHSELTWILDCFTGFGEMRRMTQFKDKSKQLSSDITIESNPGFNYKTEGEYSNSTTVGLFNYPVLMAADMLLYNTVYVPVGDDQTQHLEFTRDIAERMNNRFGDIFTVPESSERQRIFFARDQSLRIKDLQNPLKKMSKSDKSSRGVIFLTDTPEDASKKIMSATTDDFAQVRYDPYLQPGISNLLEILSLVRGVEAERQTPDEIVSTMFNKQSSYGEFKRIVAYEVANFLRNFQSNLSDVDDAAIYKAFERSEKTANEQANATLLKVQQAVGLRSKGA